MVDKYTFFEHRAEIEEIFQQAGIDLFQVRLGGCIGYDDASNEVEVRLLKDPGQDVLDSLKRNLEKVLPEAKIQITTSTKIHWRELRWRELQRLGRNMDSAATIIINNMPALYELSQALADQEFSSIADLVDLNRYLCRKEIKDEVIACLIDVGQHYFECVGERSYLHNNIYRALQIKLSDDLEKYQQAKEILECSVAWNPHYAASNDKVALVSKMLELKKIDLNNDRDEYGKLCLHKAVFCRHIQMVRLLLKYGADPRICDERGDTALDVERRMSCSYIEKMLKEKIIFFEEGDEEEHFFQQPYVRSHLSELFRMYGEFIEDPSGESVPPSFRRLGF